MHACDIKLFCMASLVKCRGSDKVDFNLVDTFADIYWMCPSRGLLADIWLGINSFISKSNITTYNMQVYFKTLMPF